MNQNIACLIIKIDSKNIVMIPFLPNKEVSDEILGMDYYSTNRNNDGRSGLGLYRHTISGIALLGRAHVRS